MAGRLFNKTVYKGYKINLGSNLLTTSFCFPTNFPPFLTEKVCVSNQFPTRGLFRSSQRTAECNSLSTLNTAELQGAAFHRWFDVEVLTISVPSSEHTPLVKPPGIFHSSWKSGLILSLPLVSPAGCILCIKSRGSPSLIQANSQCSHPRWKSIFVQEKSL